MNFKTNLNLELLNICSNVLISIPFLFLSYSKSLFDGEHDFLYVIFILK